MNPIYVRSVHEQDIRRLINSVHDPVQDLNSRVLRGDDYTRRYYALVDACALISKERDDLAGDLRVARIENAGLKLQCGALWCVLAGALIGLVIVAGSCGR